MVSATAWALAGFFAAVGAELSAPADPAPSPEKQVASALGKGGYPWYDSKKDVVKPIWPADDPAPSNWPAWNFAMSGELVGYGLGILGLSVLIVVLIELWRRYRPEPKKAPVPAAFPGSVVRIEDLPAGIRPDTADPWNEALRRRERGDYAGAIVCLFAHQLLTLERLKQLRLAPGRTGRQLVRAIDQPPFRVLVEPTLALFEAVYYGHRDLSAEAFERVWAFAEEFERRAVAGPVS